MPLRVSRSPSMSEECRPRPSRARWRRDRHRRCRNRAPWRSRGHKISSAFPPVLTASVIPPASPLHARHGCAGREVVLRQPALPVTARSLARRATIRHAHSPTAGPPRSASRGRISQRNAPTLLNALYNKTQFGTAAPIRSSNRRRCRSRTPSRWDRPVSPMPSPKLRAITTTKSNSCWRSSWRERAGHVARDCHL